MFELFEKYTQLTTIHTISVQFGMVSNCTKNGIYYCTIFIVKSIDIYNHYGIMNITTKTSDAVLIHFTAITTKVDCTMNSKKVNAMLTVNEMYALFTDAVNGRVAKINVSGHNGKVAQPYCGYDDFSVNIKKSSYSVYMNDVNRDICLSIDKKLTATKNDCDTTKKQLRCNLIKFDNIDTLKKCIVAVTENRFATN